MEDKSVIPIVERNSRIFKYYCGNDHCHAQIDCLDHTKNTRCSKCNRVNTKTRRHSPQEYKILHTGKKAGPQAASDHGEMPFILGGKQELPPTYFEFSRPKNMPLGKTGKKTEFWHHPGVWIKYEDGKCSIAICKQEEWNVNVQSQLDDNLIYTDQNGIGRLTPIPESRFKGPRLLKPSRNDYESESYTLLAELSLVINSERAGAFLCRNPGCTDSFKRSGRTIASICPSCKTPAIVTLEPDNLRIQGNGERYEKTWTSPKGVRVIVQERTAKHSPTIDLFGPRGMKKEDLDVRLIKTFEKVGRFG